MKNKLTVIVSIFSLLAITCLSIFMFGGSNNANALTNSPKPTITITLPITLPPIHIIKTIKELIPGPVKTVLKPGPIETKIVRIPVAGPTKFIFITPTPRPAVTKTITSKPRTIFSIKPKVEKQIETRVKTEVKNHERIKEFTIGLVSVLIGVILCVIALSLVYYLGRKQEDLDNSNFLSEMKIRLRR